MANKESDTSESQKPNYEHLRDELFEVRVDYKSWMRSLKVITVSISVIIFILGYFGYTKIDSIENEVIERVNQRLAVTDSLISTIDQSRIDSLNSMIIQQEERYQQTIENLDRIITTNEEIQKNLIEALPPNTRIEVPLSSYINRSPDGMFTLGDIPRDFDLYDTINVAMIFEENVNLDEIKAIFLTITRQDDEGNLFSAKRNFFEVSGTINKIPIDFDFYRGSFELRLGFLREGENETDNYYARRFPINIQ